MTTSWAFVDAMLSNVDRSLRDLDVLDEAIRDHRDRWVKLYRVGLDADLPDASP